MVDVIRIDHFRGFAASWIVPADSPVASTGWWELGPGRKVFDAIAAELGDAPIIVEDLGLITSDVHELRRELGFPGMNVLQFAFDGDPDNNYLPHRYERNSVVYVGTHDNQTTVGWFQSADERTRRQVQTYLGRDGSDIAWDMIRTALASVADLAVISLQDIMRLGDEARMNTPGTSHGNWSWRFQAHQLHHGMAAGIGELTASYGRHAHTPRSSSRDPYDYTAESAAHLLRSAPRD
jgi:4-alpha-glucanotransferase